MKSTALGVTGPLVSVVGLGGSALGGVFGHVEESSAIATVQAALEAGITLFDTAPAYGATRSETLLGRALQGAPRSSYALSTKAGKNTLPTGEDLFDYSETAIRSSVDASLERLGTNYLDVVHLHDFDYEGGRHVEQALAEGFPTLLALKREGVIRAVGAGIYFMPLWKRVLTQVSLDVVLLHNHHTLCDVRAYELLPLLEERGVAPINAAPFASGLLTGAEPAPWHPVPASARALLKRAAALAASRGSSLSRLALQFSSSEPRLPLTLFSCADPATLRTNLAWLEEDPDLELVADVQRILEPIMNMQWPYGSSPAHEDFS